MRAEKERNMAQAEGNSQWERRIRNGNGVTKWRHGTKGDECAQRWSKGKGKELVCAELQER
jgi:hypothetical protein